MLRPLPFPNSSHTLYPRHASQLVTYFTRKNDTKVLQKEIDNLEIVLPVVTLFSMNAAISTLKFLRAWYSYFTFCIFIETVIQRGLLSLCLCNFFTADIFALVFIHYRKANVFISMCPCTTEKESQKNKHKNCYQQTTSRFGSYLPQ